MWPLEIAKAAFGIANPLDPEQFQPRLMLQQPIAGGVGGAVSCPKDGKDLDPWNDVGHEVGVYPVDDGGVHVCHLKQHGDLGVSGATIHPDHVSHPPVAAVITRCSAFP